MRLSKEQELERLLTTSISEALEQNNQIDSGLNNLLTPKKSTNIDQLKFNLNKDVVNTARPVEFTPQIEADQSAEVHETAANFVSLDQVRNNDKYVITSTWDDNVNQQVQLSPFDEEKDIQGKDDSIISSGDEILANNLPELTYMGQTKSYLIAHNEEDLYLIDHAIDLTRENVELNFPADGRHTAYAEDAFRFLEHAENRYDLIVLDPPAFAKHKDALRNALKGYTPLESLACCCSCLCLSLNAFSCSLCSSLS